MNSFTHLNVLSIEQATTLPYLTLHLAEEGMRVIRVENPPRGDPNRWVGSNVLREEGMNSYFLPNNAGKQAITLNLGCEEGRSILHTLIRKLPVDIFATNQRPKDYIKLGIDYDTLRTLKPDLIWVGITGFGPESNEAAYDPTLQARSGFMALTGERDGVPLVFGLPMADLGAGEHGYGQVMRALYLREHTGQGSRVDLAMLQSAVSWMVSPIMLTESFGEKVERRGNTHQFFAPVSVYPTRDGYIYVAVGNDKQWQAITATPEFAGLGRPEFERNAGRITAVSLLNQEIGAVLQRQDTRTWIEVFQSLGVPAARVNTLPDLLQEDWLREQMITSRDDKTGAVLHLPPPAVMTESLQEHHLTLSFPPRLGEHNEAVLGALGYDVADLRARSVI